MVAALAPTPPRLAAWWRAEVYLPMQPVVTGWSSLVPFALLDVLLVSAVLALLGMWVVRVIRARSLRLRMLASAAAWTLVGSAAFYLAFLAMWGLNYRQDPLARRLDFANARVTETVVARLADHAISQVNVQHAQAHASAWTRAEDLPAVLGPAFAEAQRLLGDAGRALPAAPKQTLLDAYFRRAAVAGMMDPFFLEVMITPDALPFELPAILSHEWGHLAGYANESEASFVGWLTCMQGGAQARYSAWLQLIPRLAAELPPAARTKVTARLAAGPRADLQAVEERLRRAVVPELNAAAWAGYDRYLKANRVTGGVRSYDDVVTLIAGTSFDRRWRPRLAAPRLGRGGGGGGSDRGSHP